MVGGQGQNKDWERPRPISVMTSQRVLPAIHFAAAACSGGQRRAAASTG